MLFIMKMNLGHASDCTKKELNEWLGTLNSKQFKEVETFLKQCLNYLIQLKVTNPETKKVESEVTLEGLTSFFG